jgi:hypothetical protein
LLDSSGVVVPQRLIADQHLGHVSGTDIAHQPGQRHSILDGLVSALAHVWQHRVRRVAQQRQPTMRPARKRFAIPAVCAAKPGLLSAVDLPLITGKGLVKRTSGPSPDSRLVGISG